MPLGSIFSDMTTDAGDIFQQISELDEMIEIIKHRISLITEKIKEQFLVTSSTMSPNQNYLLSGIQKSPNSKNYIITSRGIEVVGEQEITPVSEFLDTVIHYANEPSNKIIVLKELLKHLQKMNEMTSNSS